MTPSAQTRALLEIAVAFLERAIAAERAGARRLELCDGLDLGGLTPSLNVVRRVRSAVRIPIHVMVRPRVGNFIYDRHEFLQMKKDIAALRNEGIQGVVTGVLLPDHSVDVPRTRELVTLAAPVEVTFHRAFDETPDLAVAVEDVILTGAHRILTSGGASNATEGSALLCKLIRQARGRITILPGGGIHPGNLAELIRATGACEIHTGLGTVLPYNSADMAIFESAIRDCLANLTR